MEPKELILAASDAARQEGLAWYGEANQFARRLAKTYGYSIEQVAAVIAALSPGVPWHKNKADANTVVSAHRYGLGPTDVTTNSYRSQARKAFAILGTRADPYQLLGTVKAPKTKAFYRSIIDPDSDEVVIDRWMIRALTGNQAASRVTLKQYRALSEKVRAAAKELGLTPSQAQAIIWCEARKEKDVRSD